MTTTIRRARLAGAVLTVGALALAFAGHAQERRSGGGVRVAVMDFTAAGQTAGMEALGAGMQSMLTTDLSQVSSLTVVERARLKDLQGELKLGRSGAVDPATAARVGKLAGATHLATGSFTVSGKRLRLDCRMVEVSSGRVVLATSAEGELDAFFELEKTLVNKLIASLAMTPTAKERGAVAKIHTTNLEAFRQFSQGLQLFDQQKYEEALAALKGAANNDEDFKLARLTLSEYERIVSDLRGRAKNLDTERAIGEEQARLKAAGTAEQVIARLFQVLGDKRDRARRAMALYLLFRSYQDDEHRPPPPGLLVDAFARARTADALAARYYQEAAPLFPTFPPTITNAMRDPPSPPRSLESFEEDFARALKRLTTWDLTLEKGPAHVVSSHRNLLNTYRLASTVNNVEEFARRLHLDRRGEADLMDRLYELAMKLQPDDDWRFDQLRRRAILRRNVLDIDASTRLFAGLSKAQQNPDRLRHLAHQIEENGQIARALASAAPGSPLGEYAMLTWAAGLHPSFRDGDKEFRSATLGVRETMELTDRREVRSDYVIIGDLPVWRIGEAPLWTGPRTDPLRAAELRYFSERGPWGTEPNGVVIAEGTPRRDLQARFEVAFEPPRDFWPRHPAKGELERGLTVAGRPRVGLVFATRDIASPDEKDPRTGKSTPRPLRARALLLAGDRIQLADLAAPQPRSRMGSGRPTPPTVTVVSEQRANIGNARTLAVSVQVSGSRVTATINGQSAQFTLPGAQEGFWGLWFQGTGYAGIRGLTVDRAKAP